MNTHRAVIESSVPPMLTLIARGPQDFCEDTLAQWIKAHPLGEFETAVVMQVVTERPVQICGHCKRQMFTDGVTCYPDVKHPGWSMCRAHLEGE